MIERVVTAVITRPVEHATHEHIHEVWAAGPIRYSLGEVIASIDAGDVWLARRDGRFVALRRLECCPWPGCAFGPYVAFGPDAADDVAPPPAA